MECCTFALIYDCLLYTSHFWRNLHLSEICEFAGKGAVDSEFAKNEATCKKQQILTELEDVYKRQFESFWPNVDGYSITDDQYKLYEKGSYNDVNEMCIRDRSRAE